MGAAPTMAVLPTLSSRYASLQRALVQLFPLAADAIAPSSDDGATSSAPTSSTAAADTALLQSLQARVQALLEVPAPLADGLERGRVPALLHAGKADAAAAAAADADFLALAAEPPQADATGALRLSPATPETVEAARALAGGAQATAWRATYAGLLSVMCAEEVPAPTAAAAVVAYLGGLVQALSLPRTAGAVVELLRAGVEAAHEAPLAAADVAAAAAGDNTAIADLCYGLNSTRAAAAAAERRAGCALAALALERELGGTLAARAAATEAAADRWRARCTAFAGKAAAAAAAAAAAGERERAAAQRADEARRRRRPRGRARRMDGRAGRRRAGSRRPAGIAGRLGGVRSSGRRGGSACARGAAGRRGARTRSGGARRHA